MFGGAVLKRFYEEPLTYKVKEGEDNCKYCNYKDICKWPGDFDTKEGEV